MTSLRPISKQLIEKTKATLFKQKCLITTASAVVASQSAKKKRLVFDNRSPSLQDFLAQHQLPLKKPIDSDLTKPDEIPYLSVQGQQLGRGRKFYIEVYGCQVHIFL
jgi:hypothetical protein